MNPYEFTNTGAVPPPDMATLFYTAKTRELRIRTSQIHCPNDKRTRNRIAVSHSYVKNSKPTVTDVNAREWPEPLIDLEAEFV